MKACSRVLTATLAIPLALPLPLTLALTLFASYPPLAPAAEADPTQGKPLDAKWEYSLDGGKTFSADPPTIGPERVPDEKKYSLVARGTFTIDDPAAVGAVKLIVGEGSEGALALTDAESIDRYNVGSRPNLTKLKLAVNGRETNADMDPHMLYRYATIDPQLLKKGENALNVAGVYWFQLAAPQKGTLRLETLPVDRAVLDRLPVLGPVGTDFFGVAARAVIPSAFAVTVQPLEPAGDEKQHAFDRTRQLKARVAIPPGTRRFRYSVTVKAGGAAKTYGPYEVTAPVFGDGFRFAVAGNTAVYQGHSERLKTVLARLLEVRPDVFIHTGKYVDIPPWDWMWTGQFFAVAPETLARIPLFPVCGGMEMMSPVAFGRQFYFPPDDKDFGHWTTVIGKVRFVAIETWSQSQDPTGEGLKWLDKVLAEAREDYVIVLNPQVSHCSTPNAGRMYRPIIEHTAKHVNPLLVKHKVTLTIGGHHTQYERVEPPPAEGVPTIMTCMAGGSGKPLHQGYVDQNKNSKASHQGDHYCLFEVKKDKLVMQAVGLDGKVFDTCEFAPRK